MIAGGAETLKASLLGADHVDAVASLHDDIRLRSPKGFLDPRSRSEIAELLSGRHVAVGILAGERLAAFTLVRVLPFCDLPIDEPLLGCPGDATVGYSCGLAVHPDFRGLSLGLRLLSVRNRRFQEMGLAHCYGVVACANLGAVATHLRAGGCLAGFQRDRFGLNFVHYRGTNVPAAAEDGPTVPVDDIEQLWTLFERGCVARRMVRRDDGRTALVLARRPVGAAASAESRHHASA